MNYVISALAAAVCYWIAAYTLSAEKIHHCPLLRAREPDTEVRTKNLNKGQVRVLAAAVAAGAAVVMWRLADTTGEYLNLLKYALILFCLVGSAAVDYIEHRIPNVFPLVLSCSALVILIMGNLMGQAGAQAYVVSSVFAAALCTVGMVVVAVLTRGGVGAGDIKLIAAMALMGGVYVVCNTLFWSMMSCALCACVLLLLKKKTMQQGVPFGPFLLLGYMISAYISVF